MYIILLILSLIILTLSIRPKKILGHREEKKRFDLLNSRLSKLHYKKGSKSYYKLQHRIIKAGLAISPETYQTVRLLLPLIVTVIYMLFKTINFINLKLNIKSLIEIADLLEDESILHVNFSINLLDILVISLLALALQSLMLFLMGKVRETISKKESLILQTYTIMLLKTNKPVKQILISLYERADYFKPHLKKANEKFSTNPDAALSELKASDPQGDFINICIALKQALNGDRNLGTIYLENHRNMSREVNKQIRIRNQTRNQAIGILIMIVPLLASIALVGYPWIMYTLMGIRSIPI